MKRMKSMWLRLFVTGLWFSVGLSALAQCTGDCDPDAQEQCEKRDGWYWLGPPDCRCQTADSPIIIDLNGKGIRLTDALHGVLFDLENTGSRFVSHGRFLERLMRSLFSIETTTAA